MASEVAAASADASGAARDSETRARRRGSDRALTLRLLALARPHSWALALSGLCLLISSASLLAVPYLIKQLTDSVFLHHSAAELNVVALTLLGVVLATAAFSYGRSYLLSYAGNRVVADLRVRLFAHLQRLSLSYYDEQHTGEIMSRVTADTTLVQTVVANDLLTLVQQIVTLIAVVVIVLSIDWRLALVAVAVAPVLALVGVVVGRRTRHLSERAQAQLAASSAVLQETLSAMRVVKAFGREEYETGRYSGAIDRACGAALSAARLRALFEAAMPTAGFSGVAAVLWFGGREVLAGHLTPGDLIAFLFYLIMLVGPLQGLATLYGEFQQALGAASRIFALLDTVPEIVDLPGAYDLPLVAGRVEVQGLSFAYRAGRPEALRDVDLVIAPGQTVALVGPSGAGKTTLAALLPRFYRPSRGRILIDGHDIAHVTGASLRAAIAIVPQEPSLFGGTVRENIAYGRLGASQADIEAAARAANAHDFIMALPEGYDALIGERGVTLSGGQRQRVAIARALLKDPRILILDEATSALDNTAEGLVQQALERLMVGRTTLVIAHRLTTVENADAIVVLETGRVVERGTHRALLAREGPYRRLYTRDIAGGPGGGDAPGSAQEHAMATAV